MSNLHQCLDHCNMKIEILLTVIIPLFLVSGHSKKVLFYLPVSGSSNLELYAPLVQNLATRGHEVTLVTSLERQDLKGVQQIVVQTPIFQTFQDDLSLLFMTKNSSIWDHFQKLIKFYKSILQVHSNALTNTELLSMLNNQNKSQEHQFDLIITSPMFNELGVMLGDMFSIPTILFLPVNGEHILSMSLGYPDMLSWSGEGAVSTISNLRNLKTIFIFLCNMSWR